MRHFHHQSKNTSTTKEFHIEKYVTFVYGLAI
jgi:hypothetical protein